MSNKRLDVSGIKFGRLTAIECAGSNSRGLVVWKCKCDCGTELLVKATTLKSGRKKSCGCLVRETASINQKKRTKSEDWDTYLQARINKEVSGCWLWLGNKDKDGYGVFFFSGKKERAHREIYSVLISKIPDGVIACHKCDVPSCVNPDHIFLGTAKDNAIDARDKGRAFVGEKNGRAKISKEIAIEISKSNESATSLSLKHGLSKKHIFSIKRGDSWNGA